jgi:hypothetical protein
MEPLRKSVVAGSTKAFVDISEPYPTVMTAVSRTTATMPPAILLSRMAPSSGRR